MSKSLQCDSEASGKASKRAFSARLKLASLSLFFFFEWVREYVLGTSSSSNPIWAVRLKMTFFVWFIYCFYVYHQNVFFFLDEYIILELGDYAWSFLVSYRFPFILHAEEKKTSATNINLTWMYWCKAEVAEEVAIKGENWCSNLPTVMLTYFDVRV